MFKQLLLSYIFFLPFVKLFYWPVVYAKVQVNEILFLAMLPAVFLHWKEHKTQTSQSIFKVFSQFPFLGTTLVCYALVNLMAGFHSGDLDAMLEGFGRSYLIVVMGLTAYYSYIEGESGLQKALNVWFWGAIAMAICTYAGYLLTFIGYPNRAVAIVANYPYWGTVYRAAGLTGGSGMLVLVFMAPTLYAWRQWRLGEWGISGYLCLFSILLLTLSKEVVLVLLGMAMVDPIWQKISTIFRSSIILFTALFFWAATHFLLLPKQDISDTYLHNTQFTNEKVLLSFGDRQIVETSYTALKEAGWSVALKYPWLGVGPGQFSKKLPAEKALGNYPLHLPDYDPHSTWMGAFSETGLLGLFSLVLLLGGIISFIIPLNNKSPQNTPLMILNTYLVLILIASISVDAMNFRHLWVPVGLLLGLHLRRMDGEILEEWR
ncbi:MAG: hypothetical protein R2828_04150 [Saprospiraceae bacterium]